MAKQLYANNASALLASGINSTGTEVLLEVGQGARFPVIGASQFFLITVENVQAEKEVMRVTARSGDALTVIRGQENTSAQAFNAGARVECRLTAGTLDNFVQKVGDSMEGDLDMDSNLILNADIRDSSLRGVEVIAAIRGAPDLTSNEILVPANGDPATVGGAEIFSDTNRPTLGQIGGITGTAGVGTFLRGDAQWANNLTGNFTITGDFTVTGEISGEVDWSDIQNVPEAAVGTAGIAALSDDLDDDSVTTAATANAVKQLKDLIDELPTPQEAEIADVGSYIFGSVWGLGFTEGATVAGSSIRPAGVFNPNNFTADTNPFSSSGHTTGGVQGPTTLAGSWRAMGRVNNQPGTTLNRFTLFLRVS